MSVHTQAVHFRLIVMPCCGQHVCWVNPRWPTHCPECGVRVYPTIKERSAEYVQVDDPQALLKVHG